MVRSKLRRLEDCTVAGRTKRPATAASVRGAALHQNLLAKYIVTTTALVGVVLVATNGANLWVSTSRSIEQLRALEAVQATAAAADIDASLREIVHNMRWVGLPSSAHGAAYLDARRLDLLRLMRQVPDITEIAWIDPAGLERVNVSRVAFDRMNSRADMTGKRWFHETSVARPYFGQVQFRGGSQPYMTVALRFASGEIVAAEVNLRFVEHVIRNVKVGAQGLAFVTDAGGALIAHPDIALVLQNTNLSQTSEWMARDLASAKEGEQSRRHLFVDNAKGQPVLAESAPIESLGWRVLVELPRDEVLQPLRRAIYGDIAVLVAALMASVVAGTVLGRRMVRPIRALHAGAVAIGAGQLDHRIDVKSGDEIEALASEFNLMAGRLRDSHATLEHKVAQRTTEVSDQRTVAERADRAKSRFLAAASHDLRQPMHALNLYLGALSLHQLTEPARRVLVNVRQCATAISSLLDALLDISGLDAGAMDLKAHDFRVADLLARLELEFLPQARAKGLRLRIARSSACVRSDEAVVERIMGNLVSNAIRHSRTGGVLIGCRRVGGHIRLAVYDQGPGIPADQQELVFEEFYQLANPERDRTKGLGLGLSIVKRLAALLDSSIALKSTLGRGSMFAIDLPAGSAPVRDLRWVNRGEPEAASTQDALIVIVDDDGMVLRATTELLQDWGYQVVSASTGDKALVALGECKRPPNLLICDYRLAGTEDGLKVIEKIREEFNLPIPALVITGDVLQVEAVLLQDSGIALLNKPVTDKTLRKSVEEMLGG